ncbi:MAG: DHH family phosphoesterase [Bacteroidales bacterium]|nr:DHH family phosphoesterase [Bacteroidales bacterium]
MKFKRGDILKLQNYIAEKQTVTVITHYNPDGDAVGSGTALFHYLKLLLKDVHFIIPNNVPYSINFLLQDVDYTIAERDFKKAKQRLMQTDLLFMVDINNYSRCGDNLERVLKEISPSTVLIDHHVGPQAYDVVFSYPDASSTCEAVWNVLNRLSGKKIFPQNISRALYTGIMTDTGSLSFSCNHPELYTVIANLLKSGIVASKINQKIFDTYSADRLSLLGYAISKKLKVFPKQRAAFIALSAKELNDFHYQAGDLEGVVNYCLKLEQVDFCALLSERDNKIRMSFRSKDESIDVNKFAMKYWNGGGHVMASGGKSFLPLKQVVEILTKQIYNKEFIVRN